LDENPYWVLGEEVAAAVRYRLRLATTTGGTPAGNRHEGKRGGD
jgi:hypothetical protein